MASEVVFGVRMDRQLRDAFLAAAESRDRNASQLVRDFVRDYLKQNAQLDLLTEPKAKTRPRKVTPRSREGRGVS